jgi:hypothetical protein
LEEGQVMTECEKHEVELSALIDGESDLATAIQILDHLARCPSCQAYYKRLRSLQELIDQMQTVTDAPVIQLPSRRGIQPRLRAIPLRGIPRWAHALAAVLVLAIGIWSVAQIRSDSVPAPSNAEGLVTIRLEENKGQMSDGRFLEVATELLQADRQYHRLMFQLLEMIQYGDNSMEMVDQPLLARGESGYSEGRGEIPGETGELRIVN